MKRILSFFTTDVRWKLLSLTVAILLWLVGANMNDRSQNQVYNLPLQFNNIDILAGQGLVLLNEDILNTHVRVSVRAPRSIQEVLGDVDVDVQLASIYPSIDFRAINPSQVADNEGPIQVRIDISANLDIDKNLELVSIQPRFIYAEVDTIQRSVHPILVDVVNDVAPGFELRPVQLANSAVNVTGPRSIVETIDNVSVQVDVMGIHTIQTLYNLPLVVVNQNGYDITDLVQLNVRETSANVPVLQIEPIELRVQVTGDVATGFAMAEIDIEPKTIDIVATQERLQELEYILVPVNLEAANESFVREFNMVDILPSGVFLRTGEQQNLAVTVGIEPIERRVFSIPLDNVRIRGIAAIYQILGEQTHVRIDISGSRSVVEALHYSDIHLELDLRNLQIGVHHVTIMVHLPEDTTLAMGAPSLQVQIHEPAGDTDDEDDYDHYYVEDVLQTAQVPEEQANEDSQDNEDENEANDEDTE